MSKKEPTLNEIYNNFQEMVNMVSAVLPVIETKVAVNLKKLSDEKEAIINEWNAELAKNRGKFVRTKEMMDILSKWQTHTKKNQKYFDIIYSSLYKHVKQIKQKSDIWEKWSHSHQSLRSFTPLSEFFIHIYETLDRLMDYPDGPLSHYNTTLVLEEQFIKNILLGKTKFFFGRVELSAKEISADMEVLSLRYKAEKELLTKEIGTLERTISELTATLNGLKEDILKWLKTTPNQEHEQEVSNKISRDIDNLNKKTSSSLGSIGAVAGVVAASTTVSSHCNFTGF